MYSIYFLNMNHRYVLLLSELLFVYDYLSYQCIIELVAPLINIDKHISRLEALGGKESSPLPPSNSKLEEL